MEKIYSPHNSSIFNWPANIVAMLMWIGAIILGIITDISFLTIILPFLALLFEKQSDLVRDHAAKALVLNIILGGVGAVLNIVVAVFLGIGSIGGVLPWLALPLGGFVSIVNLAVSAVMIVYTVVGATKAYSYKELTIPFITPLVEWAKAAIKTN